MTENEAIKEIRFNMSTIGLKKEAAERVIEARNMAVKALEENQQYRAIGLTPFQIYEKIGGLDIELGKYQSIGTIEELEILKEKSIPKKPIYSDYDDNGDDEIIPYKATCPVCEHEFEFGYWNDEYNHHCVCGQVMNWQQK